jgi:hypothetical protein
MDYLPFLFATIVITSVIFVDIYIINTLSLSDGNQGESDGERENMQFSIVLNNTDLQNKTLSSYVDGSIHLVLPLKYNISFFTERDTDEDHEDEELVSRLNNVYNSVH